MSERDSKDPAPMDQMGRGGAAGNAPGGLSEKHGQKKSSIIAPPKTSGQTLKKPMYHAGEDVPKFDGGGNTPSTAGGIEKHNSSKSGHVNSPDGRNAPRGKSGNAPDLDVSPVKNDSKKAEKIPASRRW